MAELALEDVTLYFADKGTGIPLLFIHPPVLSGLNFKYQLSELSKVFRIIVPDLRGHGKSQHSSQPFTYPLVVRDLIMLLDYLKIEKAVLCGYSTGGSIALQFLLQEPDRALGGILLGGLSEVMETDDRLRNLILFGAKMAALRAISPLACVICSSNAKNLQDFIEIFKDTKHGSGENMREYYQYSLYYNCTKELRNIKLPVLLINGEKDKDFIPYGHLLHKYLSNSIIKFIPDVKHQLPTKKHKEVNQMIQAFVEENFLLHNNE